MLRQTSVPLIVSPKLYIACKYFTDSLCRMAGNSGQDIFSQAENRTLGALNFVQGALTKDLFR